MDGTDKVESANFIIKLWQRLTRGSVNRKIFGAFLTVGSITGFVKIVSMIKDQVVAFIYGTGNSVDAFVIAFIIPNFVISILGGTFRAAVIPTYMHEKETKGQKASEEVLSGIMVLALVLLTVLSVLLTIFSMPILKILGSGFDEEKIILCQKIYFCFLPMIIFNCFSKIFGSVLNAKKVFGIAAMCEVVIPVFAIIFVLNFGQDIGIFALVWGSVIGFIVNSVILYFSVKKRNVNLRLKWYGFTPEIKSIIHQYIPLMMGQFIILSADMIDKSMASMLDAGNVAALNYGVKVPSVIIGISVSGLGSAIFPYFSQMVSRQDWEGIANTVKKYFWLIIQLSIPIVILLIFSSEFIVKILFERGAFKESDTQLVGMIQAMYLIQIPFYLIKALGVPLLNSLKHNKALMQNAAFHTVINISLNFILMKPLGVAGIALATSISQVISCIMVFWFLKRLGNVSLIKMVFRKS